MAFEQTIAEPVSCAGIGLHSGAPVNLRIVPAPAGRGIIFRRTDLENFEMDAVGRNVAKVSYATSLMRRGVLISTTEHLLSAFIGIGSDNAYVELDNLELPILDGSAKPFVDMVRSAGLRQQRGRIVDGHALSVRGRHRRQHGEHDTCHGGARLRIPRLRGQT